MKLAITGVSGFLGGHLARYSLAQRHSVLGISRKPSGLSTTERYHEILFELPDIPDKLDSLLKDTDALIHCAGLIRGNEQRQRQSIVAGTEALLTALKKTRLHFIYISTMAVFEPAPGIYGECKWQAEQMVKKLSDCYTIIRPTMIFGKHDRGWTRYLRMQLDKKLLFLPGRGKAIIQPVHVHDISKAILAVAGNPTVFHKEVNLGGSTPIPLCSFYKLLKKTYNSSTLILPIPLIFIKLLGYIRPRFKQSYLYYGHDHSVDNTPALKAILYAPQALEQSLIKLVSE